MNPGKYMHHPEGDILIQMRSLARSVERAAVLLLSSLRWATKNSRRRRNHGSTPARPAAPGPARSSRSRNLRATTATRRLIRRLPCTNERRALSRSIVETAKLRLQFRQTTLIVETNLGSCSMTITQVSSWEGNTPPNAPARARIEFDGFNTYSIHVRGPRERVTSRSASSLETNCPTSLPANSPAESRSYSYEPYRYSIRCSHNTVPGGGTCSLEVDTDEDEPPRMDGQYQRTITNHLDAASPQSWLSTSLAGISRSDNLDPLPVQMTTT